MERHLMDTTFVKVTNISELGGATILGVSIDTTVSAVLAILVFGLGLYFTRRSEIKSKYIHLLDVEAYLYEIFSEVRSGVRLRVKSFKGLIDVLKTTSQTDIEMEYVSDYSVELIEEIDWIDYYSVFSKLRGAKKEESASIFKNINKNIYIVKDISHLWEGSFNELISRQLEYERRWHDHITKIASINDDFVKWAKRNYSTGSDAFIDALDKTLYTYQQTQNAADLYVARKSLIDPLHNLIKQNPTEDWGRRFLDPVMGCIYAYENYTKNKEVIRKQFENYVKKLNKVERSIAKNVKDLKEIKRNKPSIWSLNW